MSTWSGTKMRYEVSMVYFGRERSLTPNTDFTAATILESFRNENAAQSVERVLKKLATKKAEEVLSVSDCVM